MDLFHKRQGMDVPGLCYFYTDAIHQFKNLLADDALKMEVIYSLKYFVDNRISVVYLRGTGERVLPVVGVVDVQPAEKCLRRAAGFLEVHTYAEHPIALRLNRL